MDLFSCRKANNKVSAANLLHVLIAITMMASTNSILVYLFFFLLIIFEEANAAHTFPRTTVINLPRDASRREHIINELSSQDIQFSWTEATYGANMTQPELSANATALARWFMTPGMIGCFLSHRRCWEQCVQSGKPLLVFEDDVVLAPNFRKIVTSAMNRCNKADLVEKWDVLLVGALGCVHPDRKYGFNIIPALVGGMKKWRSIIKLADLDNNQCTTDESVPFVHVPLCPLGCHAYIISPRGASKLIDACLRASYHVDVVAWGLPDLDIVALHPLIAWQTHSDTTIGGLASTWKKVLPLWVPDPYTGFELGWALSAPLLRIGGPFFGGKILLTNGNALGIAITGFVLAGIFRSVSLFGITLAFVAAVTALVRILASKWNSS